MSTPEFSTRHTAHEQRTIGGPSRPCARPPTPMAEEILDDPFRYQIDGGHIAQPETD